MGGNKIDNAKLNSYFKEFSDKEHSELNDKDFSIFLNGLIEHKRGPAKDGKARETQEKLSYNDILKKIKIAMNSIMRTLFPF